MAMSEKSLPGRILGRLRAAYRWRADKFQLWAYSRLVRLGGEWFIRLRWPWPLRKPWQRGHLRLFSTGGGIGDEIMCLAVLREIKARNPKCEITFICRHASLFSGISCIDHIESYAPPQRPRGLKLEYGYAIPPTRPLITLMAECVGLILQNPKREALRISPKEEWQTLLVSTPSPRVIIQPMASRWTPNKKWPSTHWIELIRMLTTRFEVIEVGTESDLPAESLGPRFHSLVAKTDVLDMAYLISRADCFIGPPSAGMHLAHAFGIPAAIIFGGYESPVGHEHPKMIPFYTPVPCAPCWLDAACPYDRKCLTAIEPRDVFAAVCRNIETRQTY
jgi:ADP-heptose:LPS heptosyltransferase